MTATRAKDRKKLERKTYEGQPVAVDKEHQPILAELVDKYGTYKNVVHKALELLQRHEQQQAAHSSSSASMQSTG